MTVRLAPLEAYQLWSQTCETDPSAIVALESRWAKPWLIDLRGKVVFDVSCGVGRWLAHAQAQGANAIGTDLCPEMLMQASKKPGLSGRLARADTCSLPLPSHRADVVLCALSLGHMTPMESALAEIARTVRPGGQLIVTDFHPGALDRGWKRTFRNHSQLYEIETYRYTTACLLDCARRCELVLQNLLEPGFDEPERSIFSSAGKHDLYERVRGIPAVLLARWRRP
jgi:ubiquinone/menaquinone biosynthesis C-methylase UbiE